MPLELGLFLGAKRYGDTAQKQKALLVLDTERYRYQRFISDIAGQDIDAHGGSIERAITIVSGWLREQSRATNIPGGRRIAQDYEELVANLAASLSALDLQGDEMTFLDFTDFATVYAANLG